MRSSLFIFMLCIWGCSSTTKVPVDGPVASVDQGTKDIPLTQDLARAEGPRVDTGPGCVLGATRCVDETQQEVCRETESLLSWVSEACAEGTRCLDQACSPQCLDRCSHGTAREHSGVDETCQLYSVAQDEAVPLGSGLHDRAREHDAWIRKYHLASGTLGKTIFSDTNYTTPVAYGSVGDSAIWTGTYLAGEAIRYDVTGAPDAQEHIQTLTEAVHRLFQVTGFPGYMARYTAPMNTGDPLIDALYVPTKDFYHVVPFQGQDVFWRGNTSRDQYVGVLMGYAHAYRALTSEPHRQMIREDIVALCTELIKERKDVTVTVRAYILDNWVEVPIPMDMQYVVMNPAETINGNPYIQIGSEEDPSDYEESKMLGFREFMPDLAELLKQIPGLGSLIFFPVPRSGTAVMLATILRIGILVTDGVPGYEDAHTTFKSFYDQHIDELTEVMSQDVDLKQCWDSYYSWNIVFEPLYTLIHLEEDPARRAAILQGALNTTRWPTIADHKNVFFDYVYASQNPNDPGMQPIIDDANAQLAQFPRPPQVAHDVDNSSYGVSETCEELTATAVETRDRPGDYFVWQRNPFYLIRPGNPLLTFPGVDFVFPYWMARRHGFLEDDASGTCLRWLPAPAR